MALLITNDCPRRRGHATALWLVSLCMVWFWAAPACGYVLKGPHVLELMVKKMAGAQTLQIDQLVVVDDPAISGHPIELRETLSFIFPDRFRSDIQHDQTHRIYVLSQGNALTVLDGTIIADRKGHFDRYKDLFLCNKRKLLHKKLYTHGVDVAVTSLGLMEDRVVFVIGASYPDDSVSQLWVDKERLLPLRWINVITPDNAEEEPERLDFIFRNWRNADGVWYPMQIDTFHNEAPIRRIQVTKIQSNGAIAAELLNIQHLMTLYKQKEDPLSDNGAHVLEMEEVQRTLEDFRKKFDP